MRKRGRTRKEQNNDRRAAHEEMERNVSGEAARRFIHKAYTSYGVEDCLKKWGIDVKGDVAGGQEVIK